jgi:hypothetical protein
MAYGCVAAVAAAPAIVVVDREAGGQQLGELDLARVAAVTERPGDQHHRVAGAGTVVGDRCSVG